MPPAKVSAPEAVRQAEAALETHGALVLRTAFGLLKNMQDAEDVAQEVFLSLLRAAPSFESEEHQKAWLLRATINRCRSVFRSAWRQRSVPLSENLAAPFTPEESAVLEAVGALPLKYRQVVYLHYIEGYTSAEIAQLLGSRQNTVLSQLSRARALLKAALKGEWDG